MVTVTGGLQIVYSKNRTQKSKRGNQWIRKGQAQGVDRCACPESLKGGYFLSS